MIPQAPARRTILRLAATLGALFVLSSAPAQPGPAAWPGMAKWEHWLTVDSADTNRAFPIGCRPDSAEPEDEPLDKAGRYRIVHSCANDIVKVKIVDAATRAVALDTTFPYRLRHGSAPIKEASAGFKLEFALVKMY